jgi:hypothetical protein
VNLEWFYALDLPVICVAAIILIGGSAEFGNWIGLHSYRAGDEKADVSTLAGAALGLLALLIAFSFSMAPKAREDMLWKWRPQFRT